MLDNYGYLTDAPADEPLQSNIIIGGNIPASGELDSAWKFRKDNSDPVSGRIITYLGGYKNIDGAAYLIKRTADSSGRYFMYQEFPIEDFYTEKTYTLNAYMRGYQINKNVSTLPEQYGTYLYVEFVDSDGDVIETAVDYSSKMPFGVSDWNLYSLSFIPNIQNTASIRVGILTDSIICETAIDDVTLTYEHSIIPDYTGDTTKTTDTTVTIDGQLNPNSNSVKEFDSLFQAEASITDNVIPSPSPDPSAASSEAPSETPTVSPSQTANPNPQTGFVFPTILGLALAGATGSGFWFIKKKMNGGDTV